MYYRNRGGACVGVVMVGLLALAANGCGKGTGSVSGTVTYQGKPLPRGTVIFLGEDKRPVTDSIDANGHYSIPRVPVGPVKIAIQVPLLTSLPPLDPGADVPPSWKNIPKTSIEIPSKYEDTETSDLTYTVTQGEQMYNLDLK